MTYARLARHFRLKAKIWLVIAGLLAAAWFALWLKTDDKISLIVKERQKSKEMVIPTKLDGFIDFRNEIPPITFDTITRDLRNYPDEFKDKSYFQHHQKKWTVQVMDVAEHKIILDYLDGRDDRKKFAYFRYADQNNKTRYLLTYGVMATFQEAMGASKLINFRLPSSTRVIPEEMRRYVDMIDNYQRAGAMGGQQKPRAVTLQETNIEVPPTPAQVTATPSTNDPVVVENTPANSATTAKKTPVEQFEEAKALALKEKKAKEEQEATPKEHSPEEHTRQALEKQTPEREANQETYHE